MARERFRRVALIGELFGLGVRRLALVLIYYSARRSPRHHDDPRRV